LPNTFKDFVLEHTGGKLPGDAFFTHCHRELFHAQWAELLDDEFVNAYEHGFILMCADGIERWLYPRIFTYLADYPEKYVHTHVELSGTNLALAFLQSSDSKYSQPW
jgi:hypothetical protein